MAGQLRLIGLVAAFVVAAAVLWWWVQRGAPAQTEPATPRVAASPVAAIPEPLPPAPAPEREDEAPQASSAADVAENVEPDEDKPAKSGTGAIQVSVVDTHGNPAAYIPVELRHITWDSSEAAPEDALFVTKEADNQGRVTFEQLPEGRFVVSAFTRNEGENASLSLSKGETETVTITMIESAPVGGIVTDAAGAPIEGAVIHLYMTSRFPGQALSNDRATSVQQRTNEEGRFAFPSLWTGTWRFFIMKEGYASLLTGWERAGDENLRYALTEGATVRGRAVDAKTNRPVPKVTVHVDTDYPRDVLKADTAEDGTFEIAHVREGEFTILPEHAKLVLAGEPIEIEILHDQDSEGHVLPLTDGAVVAGRVMDAESGRGIGGAEMRAYGGGIRESKTATTDSNGAYQFTALPGGEIELYLNEVPGYDVPWEQRERQVSVEPAKNYTDINFELLKGLSIVGRVVDKENHPLEGARVFGMTNTHQPNVMTDARGQFELSGFALPGIVYIEASRDGYGKHITHVDLLEEGLRDVVITLGPPGSVAGTVVDSNNRPVPGASVHASSRGGGTSNESTASADGSFHIQGLGEGTYSIYVNRPGTNGWGGQPAETITLAEAEDKTGLRLVLDLSGHTIAGRVINTKGEPITGVAIQGWDQHGEVVARTGPDGRFELEGVSGNSLGAMVYHPDYTQTQTQLSVEAQNQDIVLEGKGSVAGRVVHALTNEPLEQFEIQAYPGVWNQQRERSFTRKSDSNGEFIVHDVNAGSATVSARAEGFARADVAAGVVREDERIEGVLLRLYPAANVAGRVVDYSGSPVSGARIFSDQIPQNQWEREQYSIATTKSDGRFALDSLSPETTALYAWHQKYAVGSTNVSLRSNQSTEVEIILPLGAAIEGRVTADGRPASAWVNVSGGEIQLSTETNADGSFSFGGLSPGQATVSAHLRDSAQTRSIGNKSHGVVLVDNAVSEVVIDFITGDATIEGRVTLDGKPVEGHISVLPEAAPDQGQGVQVAPNGSFLLEGVVAGPVTLRFWGGDENSGALSGREEVVAASNETVFVDIQLDTRGRIQGSVAGIPAGYNAFAAVLEADTPEPTGMSDWQQLWQCCVVGQAGVDVDTGTFDLAAIAPGDYQLLVIAMPQGANDLVDSLRAWQPITVQDGAPTNVAVELR